MWDSQASRLSHTESPILLGCTEDGRHVTFTLTDGWFDVDKMRASSSLFAHGSELLCLCLMLLTPGPGWPSPRVGRFVFPRARHWPTTKAPNTPRSWNPWMPRNASNTRVLWSPGKIPTRSRLEASLPPQRPATLTEKVREETLSHAYKPRCYCCSCLLE